MTTASGSARARSATRTRWWRISDWWYLVYLGVLGFQPVFDPDATALDWAIVGATVAAFLPLYVLAHHRPGRVRMWCAAGMVVLGAVVVWVNSGASVLFVFAGALAGTFEPRELAVRWLVGLTALLGLSAALSPVPLLYRLAAFGFPILIIWIVGNETMHEADREREAAALRVDNARIEHLATVSERERIARDLHDLLGHSLSAVVVRSQLVQRLALTDPDRAAEEAAAVERTARDALSEVRAAVSGWRQVALDDEVAHARETLAAAGVTLTLNRSPDVELVSWVEQALALALRETVTNIVRHSGARHCTVTLEHADGEVVLRVADDGNGAHAPEGNGLTGLRERVTALGGRVQRDVGGGTTITIAVPAEVAT